MGRKTIKDYEKALSPLQVQIAQALNENDYRKHNEKLTMQQIADNLGVSRTTLYTHKNNPAVMAYQACLSERQLDQFRSKADASLMRLIDNGTGTLPSVKALQLYYQLLGRLVERKVVTENEETLAPRMSMEELEAELKKLDEML
jgi:AraC-like DNA-binding protein